MDQGKLTSEFLNVIQFDLHELPIFEIRPTDTYVPLFVPQFRRVLQLIRPYVDVILPAFFVSFFIVSLCVLYFNQNVPLRKLFLTGLFVAFLFVNAVGVNVFPLAHWQKFAGEYNKEVTFYELRVVDADGQELRYDHRATMSVDGVSIYQMTRELTGERPRSEKIARARFLLERAKTYRRQINSRSLLHYLRFPPHGLDNMWTSIQLDSYSEFVGIRIYRHTVVTAEGGSEIDSASETLVMEYMPDNRSEIEPRSVKDPVPDRGLPMHRERSAAKNHPIV